MAECKLSIVPTDPYFLPTKDGIKKAKAVIKRINEYIDNADIRVKQSDQPKFYTAADALESIACPRCSKTTKYNQFHPSDPDESEEIFRQFILDAINAPDALKHEVVVPCCGARLSLDDIIFKDYAGRRTAAIGRFNLRIPDDDGYVAEEKAKIRIEKALGASVVYVIEHHS